MSDEPTTRRAFCSVTARGLSGAALGAGVGALLSACDTFTHPTAEPLLPTVSAASTGASAIVTVDAASPLARVGGAALVSAGSGPLLVVRTAQDTFVALDGTCTHRVCTITAYAGQTFVCPCHGSEFDMQGAPVRGPARQALRPYATQFTDGVLTIHL